MKFNTKNVCGVKMIIIKLSQNILPENYAMSKDVLHMQVNVHVQCKHWKSLL